MEEDRKTGGRSGRLLRLFVDFLKFGCFTFGGGWSIIRQMQQVYVERRKTLTNEELLDLSSVSRSLPGVMVGNMAMLFGCRMEGLPGGLVCVAGLAIPPLIILAVLTCFYGAVYRNPWAAAAMSGVRAAVVPILLSSVAALLTGNLRLSPFALIAAVSFVLYVFFDLSCVWLVVLGGLCGLAVTEVMLRKGEKLP